MMKTKSWDTTIFDTMVKTAKEHGYRKEDICTMLGVPQVTFYRWRKGTRPHPMFQAQFPALIERMRENPRINPNAVTGAIK
jgi:hypothetical protein